MMGPLRQIRARGRVRICVYKYVWASTYATRECESENVRKGVCSSVYVWREFSGDSLKPACLLKLARVVCRDAPLRQQAAKEADEIGCVSIKSVCDAGCTRTRLSSAAKQDAAKLLRYLEAIILYWRVP